MRKWLAAMAALVVITGAVLLGTGTVGRARYPRPYFDLVAQECAATGEDPALVSAVIYHESRWDREAESSAGARGLMQLTEGTYQWLRSLEGLEEGDQDRLFDPEENIHYGCALLRLLLDRYDGRAETALAAYNAGLGNVGEWLQDAAYSDDGATLKEIPFPETAHYVEAVLATREKYRVLYEDSGDPVRDFFARMGAAF